VKKKNKKSDFAGRGNRLNTYKRSDEASASRGPGGNDLDESVFHLYLKEIDRIPLLSKEEEEKIARQAVNGNKAARERLVNANLRFTIMVAKKYQGKGLPLEDLISEGNIGLLNAVKNYDVDRGYRFITYAVWWIRQSIIKAIHEKGRIIKLPDNKGINITRIERTRQILQHEPTIRTDEQISEVATFLNLPHEEVEDLMRLSKDTLYLEDPVSKFKSSLAIKDFIEDEVSVSPADQAINNILREDLEKALSVIGKRAADVIRCRFGLGGSIPMTLKEVGNRYNLSRERVRQIEKRALRMLQHSSLSGRLAGYTA